MLAYLVSGPQSRCRRRRYLRTLDSLLLRHACCPGTDSRWDRSAAGSPQPHFPPGLATGAESGAVKPAPTLALTDSVVGGDELPVRPASSLMTLSRKAVLEAEWIHHFQVARPTPSQAEQT